MKKQLEELEVSISTIKENSTLEVVCINKGKANKGESNTTADLVIFIKGYFLNSY